MLTKHTNHLVLHLLLHLLHLCLLLLHHVIPCLHASLHLRHLLWVKEGHLSLVWVYHLVVHLLHHRECILPLSWLNLRLFSWLSQTLKTKFAFPLRVYFRRGLLRLHNLSDFFGHLLRLLGDLFWFNRGLGLIGLWFFLMLGLEYYFFLSASWWWKFLR